MWDPDKSKVEKKKDRKDITSIMLGEGEERNVRRCSELFGLNYTGSIVLLPEVLSMS